ncbi:MAG: hypothetical protein F9K46_10040 [Anaerolineae bacterium]|nr:MAG: hypothetical protein F9K46_10040 [Anaerolineae bacterium]
MSIGRVGKQAQQAAQQYQRRYQINYGPSSEAHLQPPRRSRPITSEVAAEAVQRVPMEAPIESDDTPSAVMPEMVQRADDADSDGDEGATNSDHKVSPKDVAERVYALLLRDIKREQERLGTFRKKR